MIASPSPLSLAAGGQTRLAVVTLAGRGKPAVVPVKEGDGKACFAAAQFAVRGQTVRGSSASSAGATGVGAA